MNNFFYEKLYEELSERYQKSTLTKKELASELGMSVSSINNYIVKGVGIPEYIKVGTGKNGKVLFPVVNVVDYLSNTIKVS
ncbi:helix-turn-helix transcriptional regulator [Arcobacter sp. YIC-80]|uniref:helix-turn-helix transcriptional regulator n=1 Tax=Arcobacter sp. YIC-80 TaxID=3376683 RepID=UPI003850C43D